MTRVEVDRERCVGSGTCEALAPDRLRGRRRRRPRRPPDRARRATSSRTCGTPSGVPHPGALTRRLTAEQPLDPRGCRPHGDDRPGQPGREPVRDPGRRARPRPSPSTSATATAPCSSTPRSTRTRGRTGVGSTLVRAALDDVRAQGGSVVPQCPFVRGWIERHQDYADLVVDSEPVTAPDVADHVLRQPGRAGHRCSSTATTSARTARRPRRCCGRWSTESGGPGPAGLPQLPAARRAPVRADRRPGRRGRRARRARSGRCTT